MRNHTTELTRPDAGTTHQKLPLPALLALATAVFITSLTETLPAGLLRMSADLASANRPRGRR